MSHNTVVCPQVLPRFNTEVKPLPLLYALTSGGISPGGWTATCWSGNCGWATAGGQSSGCTRMPNKSWAWAITRAGRGRGCTATWRW